jgi:heme-degrading monooxygenase HmoA
MYARSTTVHADPQLLDRGVAYARDEALPMLQGMNGYVGLSVLVDRDGGRCIATTAWDDEESMHASTHSIQPIRDHFVNVLGGTPTVHEWEIAVLHRKRETGDGAWARVSWTRADSSQMNRILEAWRSTVVPQLDEIPGFCAASLLVDRSTGRAATAVTYADRDSVQTARDAATALRNSFTQQMGIQLVDVSEFEVALARLRVPETV